MICSSIINGVKDVLRDYKNDLRNYDVDLSEIKN
jgi:hypothetical protein